MYIRSHRYLIPGCGVEKAGKGAHEGRFSMAAKGTKVLFRPAVLRCTSVLNEAFHRRRCVEGGPHVPLELYEVRLRP